MDWCQPHLNGHGAKADRADLAQGHGCELLWALVVGDRDGRPVAPLTLEVRSVAGVLTTRAPGAAAAPSQLDGLGPLMAGAQGLRLGKGRPGFTAAAALPAGLGVLLPALHLAGRYTPASLRRMAVVAGPRLIQTIATGGNGA